MSGLTDNYLRVSAEAPRACWNRITPVRLIEHGEDSLRGQLVNPGCD
jgi:hypothetical protein